MRVMRLGLGRCMEWDIGCGESPEGQECGRLTDSTVTVTMTARG
jgi:hypothetical protein